MKNTKNQQNLTMISIILRLSFASLFLGTAMIKTQGGISGTIDYYMSFFEDSMLPLLLVKTHATLIMFVEFILAIWLISGFQLKWAWVASCAVLMSLAFGMLFVFKFDVASDNYIYVIVAVLGLWISQYDRFQWGSQSQKDNHSG